MAAGRETEEEVMGVGIGVRAGQQEGLTSMAKWFGWFGLQSRSGREANAVDLDLQYPDPASWEHADVATQDRARRTMKILKEKSVPVYLGPLFCDREDSYTIRSASEVAKRAMVLWAVTLLADNAPRDEVLGIIDQWQLHDAVSPKEKLFLDATELDPNLAGDFKWRWEALWVLLWALGEVPKLEWPIDFCDTTRMAEILAPWEDDPGVLKKATLRPSSELLDQRDLIGRLAWAVRDSWINRGNRVPKRLDWRRDREWLPAERSVAALTVQQRHHALNWLVGYPDVADWDRVDTPT
jgi:hypothetical protein